MGSRAFAVPFGLHRFQVILTPSLLTSSQISPSTLEAVGQFTAEDTDVFFSSDVSAMCLRDICRKSSLDFCPFFKDQGPDAAALRDDITDLKRLAQVEAGIDIRQHEITIFFGYLGLRILNWGVGSTDTGSIGHGNSKKQAAVIGEKAIPASACQSGYNKMDSWENIC